MLFNDVVNFLAQCLVQSKFFSAACTRNHSSVNPPTAAHSVCQGKERSQFRLTVCQDQRQTLSLIAASGHSCFVLELVTGSIFHSDKHLTQKSHQLFQSLSQSAVSLHSPPDSLSTVTVGSFHSVNACCTCMLYDITTRILIIGISPSQSGTMSTVMSKLTAKARC